MRLRTQLFYKINLHKTYLDLMMSAALKFEGLDHSAHLIDSLSRSTKLENGRKDEWYLILSASDFRNLLWRLKNHSAEGLELGKYIHRLSEKYTDDLEAHANSVKNFNFEARENFQPRGE